jgi:hypothetical protein
MLVAEGAVTAETARKIMFQFDEIRLAHQNGDSTHLYRTGPEFHRTEALAQAPVPEKEIVEALATTTEIVGTDWRGNQKRWIISHR